MESIARIKVATFTFLLGLAWSFSPVAAGCNSRGSGSNGDPEDAGPDTGVAFDATPGPDGSTQDSETLVSLESGMVRGVLEDGVVAFKSIPYAAPPTEERRWRPLEPVEPWEGELQANTWPPACLQVTRYTNESFGQEDCLYLNVWRTPKGEEGEERETTPVLVFIHGGGNMFGSTSEETSGVRLYSGAGLAKASGAVVVTIQYRLNILGYFSHPDLDEELTQGASGASNQVPMVFNVNAHETATPLFGIVGSGQKWNAETYEQKVHAIFGPLADDVLAEYTVGSGPDQFPNHASALIALTTDMQFICPNRTYARTLAQNSSEPVYRYLYSHAMKGGLPGLALLGAGHGFELFYIFQHMADLESYTATPEDFQVQEAMRVFWVKLAADADPGSFGGVA